MKLKSTAVTRACLTAQDRWNLTDKQIVWSEKTRRIKLRINRKFYETKINPYTPCAKIMSWIYRQVLAREIAFKIAKKKKFDRELARKQKPLFPGYLSTSSVVFTNKTDIIKI